MPGREADSEHWAGYISYNRLSKPSQIVRLNDLHQYTDNCMCVEKLVTGPRQLRMLKYCIVQKFHCYVANIALKF